MVDFNSLVGGDRHKTTKFIKTWPVRRDKCHRGRAGRIRDGRGREPEHPVGQAVSETVRFEGRYKHEPTFSISS